MTRAHKPDNPQTGEGFMNTRKNGGIQISDALQLEPSCTLKEAQRAGVKFLSDKFNNPAAEVSHILKFILDLDSLGVIYSHGEEISLDQTQLDKFQCAVLRRSNLEPLAYIRGSEEFYGRQFLVSPDCLIPRPETEFLIQKTLNLDLPSANPVVMDVCTGSGIIGITLKLEKPFWQVYLGDISWKALRIALENSQRLGAETHVFLSNLLGSLSSQIKVDLITANPPYIPAQNKSNIMADVVNYEPHLALFSEENGLFHTRLLLEQTASRLKSRGYLVLEVGEDQRLPIQDMCGKFGLQLVDSLIDLRSIERTLILQKRG